MRVWQYGETPTAMLIPDTSPFDPPDETASSLTPVGRWDVVPWQRFSTTMKVGIVAFSKDGIYGVAVTPSGQGYADGTLTATSMTYNDRTDVWEYWVSLNPSSFSTNGEISLDATVYGEDGGRRTLDTITLYVDATGGLVQPQAWVTTAGSDTTGTLGEESLPYASISGALFDIQSTYGTCSGAVVYIGEGDWELGNATIATAGEWMTFAGAAGTTRSNVIIHGGGNATETDHIRFYDLTLRSDGFNDAFLRGYPGPEPLWLWVDSCRIIGYDRHTSISSPAMRDDNWFCTNSYIYDVDNALRHADLGRNVDIEHIGDDACVNCDIVINITVHDQDPGTTTYWHADGWQNHGKAMDNKIIYGYHGTDMHYQGIFIRMAPDVGVHTNNAFVNVLMEMRQPGRYGYDGDPTPNLENFHMYGLFDHFLVWHCTLPSEDTAVFEESNVGFGFSNVSFVGNVFYEFIDYVGQGSGEPSWSLPGNSDGNEFLHNHYIHSAVDGVSGSIWSKSPDTDPDGSQSTGDPDIVTTQDSADYGTPNAMSPLVDRLTTVVVLVDVLGNMRDATPDVGAIERV